MLYISYSMVFLYFMVRIITSFYGNQIHCRPKTWFLSPKLRQEVTLVFPSKNHNDTIRGYDPATLGDLRSFQRRANKKQQQDLDLLRRALPEAPGPVPVLSRRGPQRRASSCYRYPTGAARRAAWRLHNDDAFHPWRHFTSRQFYTRLRESTSVS